MFIADASPFLDRDVTYGAMILVFLLGVGVSYLISRRNESNE